MCLIIFITSPGLSEISATQYKLSVVYVITPIVGCLLNSLPVASQLPITAG